MSLITLDDADLTAPMVAKTEMNKIYNVLYDQVQKRLETCEAVPDGAGGIEFKEPADMKWYLRELRETAKVMATLEQTEKTVEAKTAVDIMKIMAQQMKLSRKEKEQYRRDVIEVEEDAK